MHLQPLTDQMYSFIPQTELISLYLSYYEGRDYNIIHLHWQKNYSKIVFKRISDGTDENIATFPLWSSITISPLLL